MKYSNIANIINEASKLLVLDANKQPITVLPDLSNIVDFGKAMKDIGGDTLKDFQRNLVVGIYNEIITRTLSRVEFGFAKTTEEYGGALQRIIASNVLEAQDSHLLNLVNGESYLDGKFYGIPTDARIYNETKAFKIVYSVSEDTFKNYFMSATEVANYMGYISIVAQNSINKKLNTWECGLLAGIINNSDSSNRISITKQFNKEILGGAEKTLAEIIADKDLFIRWCNYAKAVIEILISRVTDVTLGDGITTPIDKVKVVLNQKFESFIKNMSNSYLFNVPSLPEHKTVNCWNVAENVTINNSGVNKTYTTNNLGGDLAESNANLLAYISNGSSGNSAEFIDSVIGVIYDSDCAGITIRANKVTIEEVGTEGFRNLHHHLAADMYADDRFKTYVITL